MRRLAAIIGAIGIGCSNQDVPSEPPRKWLDVQAAVPAAIPYGIASTLELRGENLDGVTEVLFVSTEGVKRGSVVELGSSSIVVRSPYHEWFGTARVIVSEGSEPYHQRDTLPGNLLLVGPAHPDTIVYEYRSGALGERLRWREDRFPLRVYLHSFSQAAQREAAIAGIFAWNDAVRSGIPAFEITSDSLAADILLLSYEATLDLVSYWSSGTERWIERVTMNFPPGFFEGDYDERQITPFITHDMGHALGLQRHSRRQADIMGSGDGFVPSLADIRTLQHLYAAPQ